MYNLDSKSRICKSERFIRISRLSDYKQALGSKRSHWKRWEVATNKQITREEQNMSENKETKQEVTNEQILEHLKEIEIAQGCIANGINTLFSVIGERKEQLKLSSDEVGEIHIGQIALTCITESMADISGMNESMQKIEEKVQKLAKEEVENFLDFLKEILG